MKTSTFYFPNPDRPAWNGHSHHVKALLGLKPNEALPTGGMVPRLVPAVHTTLGLSREPVQVLMWVRPLLLSDRGEKPHRVMCRCPGCGKTVTAGRLHQHVCKPNIGEQA